MADGGRLLDASQVHPEWRPLLADALARIDADYLASLNADGAWLPGRDNLFAAFRRDRAGLRYLLLGESPYPRVDSANGIAFFDAAVGPLWSERGLSKPANRATSLRNLLKTALLAEGRLGADPDGRLSQASIAALDKRDLVQTLPELFANLERAGFLLFNATPVLHPARKVAIEARYWRGFLARLLEAITLEAPRPPTLILWGKIAETVDGLTEAGAYRRIACEHPYNLSFIENPEMRRLFAELRLLQR